MNKSNIVLIGMPGVGKSTIGVLLAKALGRYFMDTDIYIQLVHDKSLSELIDEKGLEGFCEIEKQYCACLDVRNAVIATGGSVVYYEETMKALSKDGVIVYLYLPVKILEKRVFDTIGRGVVMEPGQNFQELYDLRTPLYSKYADLELDLTGLDHEACVGKLIESIKNI